MSRSISLRDMWSGSSPRPGESRVPHCFTRNEKPRACGAHCQQARRRYCFLGASLPVLPDVPPLPDGEGLVEGLVMLPALPPVLARASVMHFSRSVPVSDTHFAGTSVEELLAEPLVPLDGLSLCA